MDNQIYKTGDIERDIFRMAGRLAGSLYSVGLKDEAMEFTNKVIEHQDDCKMVLKLCIEYTKLMEEMKGR